jgi:hypothetical protein
MSLPALIAFGRDIRRREERGTFYSEPGELKIVVFCGQVIHHFLKSHLFL